MELCSAARDGKTDRRLICTVLTGETVRADNILRERRGGVLQEKTAGGDFGRVFRKAAENPVSTLMNSVIDYRGSQGVGGSG